MRQSNSCLTLGCAASRLRSAAASCSRLPTKRGPSACEAACWTARAATLFRPRVSRGHFDEYQRLGDAAIGVLSDFTPAIERISIDEAFADVAGCTHLFGSPAEIARTVRARVRAELGLPISIGVARTKHLAKIASQVAKPDGLVVVDPETELEFLHELPVALMWGVGLPPRRGSPRSASTTIGQLAESSPQSVERLLGHAVEES